MPIIELINLTKSYDGEEVLKDVNLYFNKDEFVTLLGPSGCGKTTTLRLIGGFEKPSSGDVRFKGKSILDLPPYKRNLNTVFQKYALFPHMSVAENIAFGLEIQKKDKQSIREITKKMLTLVNLENFEHRSVSSLSGGQQQRIAIVRALVNQPEVLLFDEPLGALDLKLRKEMQIELKNMQKELGITFIYVTHDQEEALTMSDSIVVMNKGEILQIGTPEKIYNEPKNAFVAAFIGESNILSGVMLEDYKVSFHDHVFDCVDHGFQKNEAVDIVLRPEDLILQAPTDAGLTAVVEEATFKGVHYEMQLIDHRGFLFKARSTKIVEEGQKVSISVEASNIHVMKKYTEAVERGEESEDESEI